jgi:GNAT superfamily N-acetyltransferase
VTSWSAPTRAAAPPFEVALRPFPLAEARGLVAGGGQRPADWADDFPSTDTVHGLALILEAYAALGTVLDREPDWWVNQIVVNATVVGEAGFHGPPDPDGAVEIGYEVGSGWRRRGVATRACGLLLDRAWSLGARVVRAEAAPVNVASRRVLTVNGFRPDPDGLGPDGYRVDRP